MEFSPHVRSWAHRWSRRLLGATLFALMTAGAAMAQVATLYSFAQSSGTWTSITGGTQLNTTNNSFDDQLYTVTIPEFFYDGTYYTTMYVSANGFITFGAAPAGNNYTPLSSTAAYSGAISVFGANLANASSGTRDIRFQQVGDELVVQWRGARRSGQSESFDLQIRLHTVTGAIVFRYNNSSPSSSTSNYPQVGLRGPNNTFATNVNNRSVEASSGAGSTWANSAPGANNGSECRYNNTTGRSPANGQTYTWTPACLSPVAEASVVTDCATNTYTIQVDVTKLGSAANVNIQSPVGTNVLTGVGTGSYTIGPIAVGTSRTVRIVHTGNAACNLDLGSFNGSVSACLSNGNCLTSPYLTVPDNGCSSNNVLTGGIQISGYNNALGTSVDLQSLELIAAHDSRGQLQVKLTSPTGQTRNISISRGSTGDNIGNPSSCPGGAVIFRDDAASAFTTTSNNPTGAYRPDETLAGFTGDPNGLWTVTICDGTSGTTGTLRYAKLNFCNRPGAATATQTTDCATNTFSVAVNVSATYAAGVSIVASPGGTLLSNIGTGTYTVGPFANGTPVSLKLTAPGACDLELGSFVNEVTCMTNGNCLANPYQSIPDNGCSSNNVLSTGISISGLNNNLGSNVDLQSVELIVAHASRGQLQVKLTSPTGQTRNISVSNGGTSDNIGNTGSCPGGAVIFRDDAATAFSSVGSNNPSGPYRPDATLAGFTGDPNGLWTVTICDGTSGTTGTLRYVKLNFCDRPVITATSSNSPSCTADQLTLGVTATGTGLTYAWTGAGTFSPNASSANVTVSGAATGTYSVTVSNGCNNVVANVPVVVNQSPTGATANSSAASVCSNANTVNLTSAATFNQTLTSGAGGTTSTAQINTIALGPNPMQNYYGGVKQQMLWRASELTAMGMVNGTVINSVAINLATASGSPALQNFRVKVQQSGTNALSATPVTTGWSTVFGPSTVTPVAGLNTFTFSPAITWNGTSNLLIEFNYSNNNSPNSATNSATYDTGLSFVATNYYRVDNTNASTVDAYSGTMTYTYQGRNNVQFGVNNSAAMTFAWTSTPSGFTSSLQNPTGVAVTQNTTYMVMATVPNGCTATASTAVNVVTAPNAGSNGSTTVCSNGAAFDMASFLGAHDNGGSWKYNGNAHSGTFTPGTDAAGVYTYTVNGTLPCANASATVTVNVTTAPNAGSNGSTTVCSNGAAFDMASFLGAHDNGGSWTYDGNAHGNTFTPGTDVAGVYTYTVNGTSPCANAAATVTVNVTTAPNAGSNGSTTVCSNGAAFDMASFLGTHDNGGSWTYDGNAHGNTFTPGTDVAGVYTYTVNGTSPCANASATVTVNVTTAPNAGSNGSTTVCSNGTAFDMASFLGTHDNGGSWTYDGNAHGNTFTPGTDAAGIYTYTVNGTSPCANASATVTVNVTTAPNAGSNGSTTVCSNGTAFDMASFLGTHDNGGSWTYDGNAHGNTFTPGTDAAGVYTYTVNGTSPCANASATVTVGVNALPVVSAGSYGPLCTSDAPIALTDGSPAGGTFSGTGVSGGDFDPSVGTQTITYNYTDGNSCSSSATTVINVNIATAWYLDSDGDTYGAGAATMACTSPGANYVTNDLDDCPALYGRQGDSCNDNNPFTTDDVINGSCVCAGIPVPSHTWSLKLRTDHGTETTWEVREVGSNYLLASDGPYGSSGPMEVTTPVTIPDAGHFTLRVLDSGNNGMGADGGYVLRDHNGNRVIDNWGNGGGFTSVSESPEGFSTPVGTDVLTATQCDNVERLANEMIICNVNPLVSAKWGVGDQTTSGYEFWFFDPNGSYSRHILRPHATSGGYAPADATRAAKLGLASWSVNPLPANTLLNVRVRGRVEGVNLPFGPACRLKVDPVAAECHTTQLENLPGSNLSCGVTGLRTNGSNAIYAKPVRRYIAATNTYVSANRYKFHFENTGEGQHFDIVQSTYPMMIYSNMPFRLGATYDVTVQASMDGGVSYCPVGATCQISFATSNARMEEVAGTSPSDLLLWPNPNRGDELHLNMASVADGLDQVTVDVVDMYGKRVMARTITVNNGSLNTVLSLDKDLASGLYLVNLTAGDRVITKRLVIQR
ncbi:MAG: T9SS type A sorting domain-containing protein [Flavobacteriales bacterium]